MSHQFIVIEDGLLNSAFIGDVNEESIVEFNERLSPFLDTATPDNPIHFLADASHEGRWSGAARRAFTKMFATDPRLGKVAIINAARFTRVMATFIIKATGRHDAVRFFDNETEALAWLKG